MATIYCAECSDECTGSDVMVGERNLCPRCAEEAVEKLEAQIEQNKEFAKHLFQLCERAHAEFVKARNYDDMKPCQLEMDLKDAIELGTNGY